MRRHLVGCLLVGLAIAGRLTLSAQLPPNTLPSIQQSATRLDSSLTFRCDSVTGTTTQTLALQNPGAGQSDYIISYIANIEATGAVAAANPIAVTSSNINGTSPTFGSISGLALTQGGVAGPGPVFLSLPIKGVTNAAPSLVIVAPSASVARLTACYTQAP